MAGGYGPSGQPEGVVKPAGASLVVGDCAVPAKASESTKAATTSQGLWWGKCMRDIPGLLAGRKPKRWFVSTKANASEAALKLADESSLTRKTGNRYSKTGWILAPKPRASRAQKAAGKVGHLATAALPKGQDGGAQTTRQQVF